MRLADYQATHGAFAALVAAGQNEMAANYEAAENTFAEVVAKEGAMPFESRPIATQERLNQANAAKMEGDDWLWKNRNMEINI